MTTQSKKIELIKRLADVESESIINKIKAILVPKKQYETERLMANPELVQQLREARQGIKNGKGVKLDVKELWK